VGRSLRQAVVTAVLLVALMALSYWLGRPAFLVLICTVVLLSLYELLDALVRSGRRPSILLGLACGLSMVLVAYFQQPAYLALVLGAALFGSFLLALRRSRGATAASDVAWTLLAVGWIGGGGAAATLIMMLDPGGLTLITAFVVITALDDISAYFVGTRWGRHKMAPSISPAKSWEGVIAGAVGAVAGGLGAGFLLDELAIVDGLAIGALCSLLGPVGDLVESMVKREIGVKDSGWLLPGHGGFLDRLDAIVFCAPAVYLYLLFVVYESV
jgi:phosphatidate cytidylyltransferase